MENTTSIRFRQVHFLIDSAAGLRFIAASLTASHFFKREQVAAFEQAEHAGTEIVIGDFIFTRAQETNVL